MMLYLYLRTIHPEFFKIYAWRSYRGPDLEAEVWITGLSHVLTVRRLSKNRTAERCLTEVIGPAGLEIPDRGRVQSLALVGEDEAAFHLRNGFHHQISFATETLDDEHFASSYEELRAQAHKEGVSCEYRIEGVEKKMWPLALMFPDHARGGFLLHAFHVFPEQRSILKTQTLIELPEK
jgi:hypothetical protein